MLYRWVEIEKQDFRKEFLDKEIADFTNCEDDAIPEVEITS